MNNATVFDEPDDVMDSEDKGSVLDFKELSDDVKNIIDRSAEKSYLLDPIPTSIIVQCADELLPIIRK